MYELLRQQHESARLDASRKLNIVQLIDPPLIPDRPVSRGLVLNVALAGFVGAFMAIMLAFIGEFLRQRAQDEPAVQELPFLRRFRKDSPVARRSTADKSERKVSDEPTFKDAVNDRRYPNYLVGDYEAACRRMGHTTSHRRGASPHWRSTAVFGRNKDVEVMTMAKYEAYFQEHRERHLRELNDFLRIPSVSALPEHADDVKRAARWAADNFGAVGVPYVEIIETEGHPSVYGQWIVDEICRRI